MMVRFYTKGWFDIWNPPCYKVIVLEREKKSPVSCLKSRCGVFVFPKGENMNKQAEKILLTKEGNNKLKEEYRELTEVRRHEIAEKIQDAREMGDLSENASYQTAKEEQAFIEGRIAELEEIFRNSTVVESNLSVPRSKFTSRGMSKPSGLWVLRKRILAVVRFRTSPPLVWP